jgi:MoaD family protein
MPTIGLFAELRRIAGASELTVQASTVGEALNALPQIWGDAVRKKLLPDGQLSEDLIVLVNGRNIQFLGGLDAPVAETDRIAIVPIVGGGSA